MSTNETIEFELTDHRGRPTRQTSFPGRRSLVFFGFTHCRTVCPRALDRLQHALALLGDDAGAFQPLYITVDPDRDDETRMRSFLRDRPGFLGLTGTATELEATRRAFHAFAKRKEDSDDPDGYVVPHTALTYVLDDTGHLLAHLGDAMSDEQVADALHDVLHGIAPGPGPGPGPGPEPEPVAATDGTAAHSCPADCPVGCCS